MGRKSKHSLPPGIQLDQHDSYWATLEGDEATLWRKRYPGRSLPRRKAESLKEALKLQRQLIDDLKAARDPNAENPKVADWVRTCINRKRKLAPSTAKRYRSSLQWQIEPHTLGRMRLMQVLKRHVEQWVDELVAQKHQRHDERTLDPYSIRNAFAVLRMSFNIAVADGLIGKNPCIGVELPRPDDEEIHPLTPEQVEALLAVVDSAMLDRTSGERRPHHMAALYHVAVRCGLRQGELFGLRLRDMDLERCVLHVSGQMQNGARTPAKTRRSHRTIPLTADLVRVLRWHFQNQCEERNFTAEGWNSAGLLFCSENGTPLNPSNLSRQFDIFLRTANLPNIRFHDLRHTYAALSIAAGVDLYTLSRRMGHNSITVTADKYGHLYQGHTQDIESLDRLLKRA
jgi:integrase